MRKTLYILGGLASAFSLSTAFPMAPCAFNRYVAVSDSCLYSRIAVLIFGIVGVLSALALLLKSRAAASGEIRSGSKTFLMLLIVSLAFQIAIAYRAFTAHEPAVCGIECMPQGPIVETPTTTQQSDPDIASSTATTSGATTASTTSSVGEKTVTLKLNEIASIGNKTVKVTAVTEDSRCPLDVQCFWAGRVRVLVSLGKGIGANDVPSAEMEPGQTKDVGDLRITVLSVYPHPVSTRKIADGEYRFTLKLIKN